MFYLLLLMKRKIILLLLISFITYSFILFIGDLRQTIDVLLDFPLVLFLFIILLTSLNYFMRFFVWVYLSKWVNLKIKLIDNFLIYSSSFSFSLSPGKAGDLIRGYFLKKMYNTPYKVSTSLVFTDRFGDLVGVLLFVTIGIFSFVNKISFVVILYLLILLFLVLIQFEFIVYSILDFFKMGFLKRFGIDKAVDFAKGLYIDIKKLLELKPLSINILVSFFSWALEGYGFYLILSYFGVEISFIQAGFIYGFSSLAGAISFLPGGLGVAEISSYGLLTLIGVESSVAAASTILIRVSTLWFGVLFGAVNLWLLNKKIKGEGVINAK